MEKKPIGNLKNEFYNIENVNLAEDYKMPLNVELNKTSFFPNKEEILYYYLEMNQRRNYLILFKSLGIIKNLKIQD
jgi:protease II